MIHINNMEIMKKSYLGIHRMKLNHQERKYEYVMFSLTYPKFHLTEIVNIYEISIPKQTTKDMYNRL